MLVLFLVCGLTSPIHLTKDITTRTTNASSTSRESLVFAREAEIRKQDTFTSLTELAGQFTFENMNCIVIKRAHYFTFYSIDDTEGPKIRYAFKLFSDLHYEMLCEGIKVKARYIVSDANTLPSKITSFLVLNKILNLLADSCEKNVRETLDKGELIEELVELLKNPKLSSNKKISFLTEQLSLVFCKPSQKRYSSSLLAMAVMWQKISPSAYRHMYHEDVLTLPTERRIRQLTSAIKAYLRARISRLEAKDLLISVLIDEIYSSKQVQYVNGSFYGNEDENVSKTVLSIMIASIAGKYRDVIAMIPCSSLNAEKQYEIWSKLLPPLCEIGFDPVATITNGNHVNHKFFKDLVCCGTLNLCISNPCNQLIDKFLLFDTVHIFKCFYTNFLNKELLYAHLLQTNTNFCKEILDIFGSYMNWNLANPSKWRIVFLTGFSILQVLNEQMFHSLTHASINQQLMP